VKRLLMVCKRSKESWWRVVAGGLAVALCAAACAGAQQDPVGASAQEVPPDVGNGTATPVVLATDAPPVSQTADASVPASDDTVWTYVALGDSVTWGMIPRYAEMLEEDLGVTVIVQDRTVGGDHSSQLLERLRTSNWLRKELREADVITIEIPWNVFEDPCLAFLNGSPGACGGSDNQDCLREALETYKADTDAIIAEIVSLRSPSEALIRISGKLPHTCGTSLRCVHGRRGCGGPAG
jgi:hypothetical protein